MEPHLARCRSRPNGAAPGQAGVSAIANVRFRGATRQHLADIPVGGKSRWEVGRATPFHPDALFARFGIHRAVRQHVEDPLLLPEH